MNIQGHAYQLTAYEVGGAIDYKAYLKDIVKEQLEESTFEEILEAYNHYCRENSYEEFLENDEELFETYFETMIEAVRATQYGKYNFADDYAKFNGYANLDSYSEYEVIKEILEDTNFHSYIIDWAEDFDFINIEELIEKEAEISLQAYELISKGY